MRKRGRGLSEFEQKDAKIAKGGLSGRRVLMGAATSN